METTQLPALSRLLDLDVAMEVSLSATNCSTGVNGVVFLGKGTAASETSKPIMQSTRLCLNRKSI